MMLAALNAFARERGLADDPLYEVKPVDFLIRIDVEGGFIGLESTVGEGGKGKPMSIPRLPQRSANIAAGFFADYPKYVLGHDKEESTAPKGWARPTGKSAAKLDAFLALVQEVTAQADIPEARAVEAFLKNASSRRRTLAAREPEEWTGSEMLAFVVGESTTPVHQLSGIRAWWEQRAGARAALGKTAVCLVSGKVSTVAGTHPKLKNVPQAQSSGASLVSFNAGAFESHGLKQGDNAPISQDVALGYVLALNDLLRKSEQRRYRQGIQLGDDSVLVFWTGSSPQQESLLLSWMDPTDEDLKRFLESPLRGLEPGELDDRAFYAVTLAGNSGRVAVRDWFQSRVGDVKHHIQRYFEDLRIGNAPLGPIPVWRLLKAVEAPSGRGLSPDLATRMVGAALRGHSFPRQLLTAALDRLRLPPADDRFEREQLRLRVALIKATLSRLPRSGPAPLEVTVSLDKNNRMPPYVLGRLFAVLERLQGAALGDLNTTIRDRYFGAASRNPAMVFPRLIQLSVHHVAKLGNSGRWLERTKSEVVALLPSERFPRVLGLEDQGLFAVGYYHQREAFFTKRSAPEDAASTGASVVSPD
ncbi:type I-C CRISPR-associated protein Cas8c/Csd1 [Pyxidicoccus xibeiensis]|uniref:type I-C CRISPR-associated protein Cas8c/Csd1 n=1 Tax=Pyxidicoccus xibeiensis TaxID=2906759 RepID=UPI0020A7085B|nr:type I-C CRISPR-associated protein Cas8c/Csd1 [Pyxidicoccus xibeiensis]MCP3139987.1 type I-C CRISPR-associated protein Cas8c/Csd1 [Pyxidicoccus xibeiensis]